MIYANNIMMFLLRVVASAWREYIQSRVSFIHEKTEDARTHAFQTRLLAFWRTSVPAVNSSTLFLLPRNRPSVISSYLLHRISTYSTQTERLGVLRIFFLLLVGPDSRLKQGRRKENGVCAPPTHNFRENATKISWRLKEQVSNQKK